MTEKEKQSKIEEKKKVTKQMVMSYDSKAQQLNKRINEILEETEGIEQKRKEKAKEVLQKVKDILEE